MASEFDDLPHLAERRALKREKSQEGKERLKQEYLEKRAAIQAESERYAKKAAECAEEYGVQPSLALGLMWTESKGDPNSRSPQKAIGLMQVQSDTAREVKEYYANNAKMNSYVKEGGTTGYVKDLDVNKPEDNIRLGILTLRMYMERYNGDSAMALNRYNASEDAMKNAGGDFSRLPSQTRGHQETIEEKMREVDGVPLPKSSLLFYLPKEKRDDLYGRARP